MQLINPSTSPNELNTTLTPHSIIHGDACFAYFNKIWGIPLFVCGDFVEKIAFDKPHFVCLPHDRVEAVEGEGQSQNRAATFYAQRDWGETPLILKTRPRPAACEMQRCLAVLSVTNSGPGGYGVRVSP